MEKRPPMSETGGSFQNSVFDNKKRIISFSTPKVSLRTEASKAPNVWDWAEVKTGSVPLSVQSPLCSPLSDWWSQRKTTAQSTSSSQPLLIVTASWLAYKKSICESQVWMTLTMWKIWRVGGSRQGAQSGVWTPDLLFCKLSDADCCFIAFPVQNWKITYFFRNIAKQAIIKHNQDWDSELRMTKATFYSGLKGYSTL